MFRIFECLLTMMKFLGVATKSDDELLSLSSRGTPFQRRKKWGLAFGHSEYANARSALRLATVSTHFLTLFLTLSLSISNPLHEKIAS